ncbi:MAG: AAA family ATPase, partial [Clostridium sp.]|nr:AAA family ATPase [Clostridium sp.]
MLLQLNISNFALIEKLSVSFEKGFNVLSGETGAGKSILIDAINYVLGIKFTKNSIRTGEKKTFVEAVFTIENKKTSQTLNKFSIDFDDMLIISRESFKSGKSIAKVNGKTIILSQLREISSTIIDIHGQHENQNLMSAEKHILYLDNFGIGNLTEAKKNYTKKYFDLKEIQSKIDSLINKTGEKDKMADFLKYQIDEIDAANLKIGEDSKLQEKYSIISRGEKINEVLSTSYEQLYNGSENYPSIFDGIGSIVKEIRGIQENSKEIKDIADSLESIYYNIEQNVSEIRDIKDNIDYNPEELEYLNSRLYTIDNFKKKYGDTIEKIMEYRNKISGNYDELVHYSEILDDLKKQRQTLKDTAVESAKKVHQIREKIALNLEEKVVDEFK